MVHNLVRFNLNGVRFLGSYMLNGSFSRLREKNSKEGLKKEEKISHALQFMYDKLIVSFRHLRLDF